MTDGEARSTKPVETREVAEVPEGLSAWDIVRDAKPGLTARPWDCNDACADGGCSGEWLVRAWAVDIPALRALLDPASRVSSQPPRNDGSALGKDRQDARGRCMAAGELAAPIYAAHGWEWERNGKRFVPDAKQIGDRIWSLYEGVAATDGLEASRATGRLSVWLDPDDGSIAVDVHLADLRDPPPHREWDDYCKRLQLAELEAEAPADFDAVESACKSCAGLSADVTRLEAERDDWHKMADELEDGLRSCNALLLAAEVRVKELEERERAWVSAALAARALLNDLDEAIAAGAPETWDGPYRIEAPVFRDTADLLRATLRSLESALPPVPVGPDGETEANSAKGAEVRGKDEA